MRLSKVTKNIQSVLLHFQCTNFIHVYCIIDFVGWMRKSCTFRIFGRTTFTASKSAPNEIWKCNRFNKLLRQTQKWFDIPSQCYRTERDCVCVYVFTKSKWRNKTSQRLVNFHIVAVQILKITVYMFLVWALVLFIPNANCSHVFPWTCTELD